MRVSTGCGARDQSQKAGSLRVLLQPPIFRNAALATTMNTLAMFGYWGLFTWIPAYLSLPDEVIVAVMRGHQRYFALRDGKGALMPRYLAVVNTAIDPATIAKGNDRVLRARLNDAAFFVREDLKKKVWEDISPLDRVVFQAKLGSVGAKVRRVQSLAAEIAPASDKARAFQAAAWPVTRFST